MIVYAIEKSSGNYDDYHSWIDFAFKSKEEAEKYVTKFNNLLEKLKEFYASERNYDESTYGQNYFDIMWYKYHLISDINNCNIKEIEIR